MAKDKEVQEVIPGMPSDDLAARYLKLRELQERVDLARGDLVSARAALKAALDAVRR